MHLLYRILLLILFSPLFSNGSPVKTKSRKTEPIRHYIGFQRGFGFQNGLKLDYRYKVHFFQLQYSYAVFVVRNWSFELLFQPQYNLVQLKDNELYIPGWEAGLNGGVLIRKSILKNRLGFYVCVSAGPHYIHRSLPRQTRGFIFSDNFFGGVHVKLFKPLHFDARFGLRHLSNAGIKNPNGGINNLFVGAGFLVTL